MAWTNGYAQALQLFVLFTPLLRYDAQLVPQPYGAESWSVNADTTVLTFHLRRDIVRGLEVSRGGATPDTTEIVATVLVH